MRRRLVRVLLVALVALLVLVAIAPTLAGTRPVRRWVEGKLAAALGRPVALAELEAGWTKGVALHGLSVPGRGAEFGEDALLEIASVSVTDPLTQLLFGGGPTRIVIDGLAVRVEEQAGGRTNVDDLLERLAAPRPPAKPPAEPPPPLQLELRHCTFRFQRLPYRAPRRRVDPFEEDAVIRDAGEGALRLGIESFDLTVSGDLKRQAIRFAGGVTVNGKGGHLAGSIEIAGEDLSAEVKADDLDLELLKPFVPFGLRGKLDLKVGLSVRLAEEGPIHVEGVLSAEELLIHEADLLRPRVVLKVDGRRDRAGVRDVQSDILVTAVRGHLDTVTAHGLVIQERGGGELLFDGGGKGYTINAVVKQRQLIVDQVQWNEVTLTVSGLLRKELQKRLDFTGLSGELAFERWQLGPLPFTDATCNVRFRDGMVALNGIRARYSRGEVAGDAKLWPRGTDVKWWTHLQGRDIQLSADLGEPLSFLVPILRVNRKDKQGRLGGKVHTDFVLKCEGTTTKLLQETMNGYGSIDFDDIEVHNSVLLPLLGLRVDKVLLNRPYKFKDLHVDFKLTDGLLKPKRFKLKGQPFGIEIWGEANLRGTLDFIVATPTTVLPMRVSGPFDGPSVRPAPGARLGKDK